MAEVERPPADRALLHQTKQDGGGKSDGAKVDAGESDGTYERVGETVDDDVARVGDGAEEGGGGQGDDAGGGADASEDGGGSVIGIRQNSNKAASASSAAASAGGTSSEMSRSRSQEEEEDGNESGDERSIQVRTKKYCLNNAGNCNAYLP